MIKKKGLKNLIFIEKILICLLERFYLKLMSTYIDLNARH